MKTMRYMLTILTLFSSLSLTAQDFSSGTIKFEITTKISDAQKKAMENYGVSLPTNMVFSIEGMAVNIKMLSEKGTTMEMMIDQTNSYYLDRKGKTAYKAPENERQSDDLPTKVAKTEEFQTILGHKCRKYDVTRAGRKEFIWAAEDLKITGKIVEQLTRSGNQYNTFIKEIDGVPLRISAGEENHGFEMIAVSISTDKPDEANFNVPSDFKMKPFDSFTLQQMMLNGSH